MAATVEILAAIFAGSAFGSFLGPLLLEEVRKRFHNRRWVEPRKRMLKRIFQATEMLIIDIHGLSIAVGSSEEEVREMLVSLGGEGRIMTTGEEGWTLKPDQVPIQFRNVDQPADV